MEELVRQRWPEIEERYTAHVAYFAARNLVHLLSNGPDDYRARFRRYLTLGANGLPWDDAWNMAFRDLAADRLAADYRDYTFREVRQIRDAHPVVARFWTNDGHFNLPSFCCIRYCNDISNITNPIIMR